ncbi:PilW family protein [Holophaga foetida]|uniref:PilW family protein n=1 Tax=Holophaga foetida TaxID=35839 RepID=UPI0002475064|nr:hypothetical protein [Holophaga foetida]
MDSVLPLIPLGQVAPALWARTRRRPGRCTGSACGFSLVELLVALVFTMMLMAGMAAVFKSSLSTFYTSGEKLSSSRRNRMSIDLLSDDLNNAGMYLVDLSTPPSVASTNPPFWINPSKVTDWNGTGVTQGADQLLFYTDEPLPFEGELDMTGSTSKSAPELVVEEASAAQTDFTYKVDCRESAYAKQVKVGDLFILKDSWEVGYISSVTATGASVTLVAGADPNVGITGRGGSGLPSRANHLDGTRVVFVHPGQMVRYSIERLKLDPAVPDGIPCLVRDQGGYATGGFTANGTRQIITENVSGFRVYLSADSGNTWIGGPSYDDKTWADMRSALDSQLQTAGRTDYKSTASSEHWFRSIPVLVRVDVTTRTATQRTEFSDASTPTLAYKEQTQSLVMVPRHFGLTMN